MRSRTAILVLALLVVAGGVAAYLLLLRGDNVAPLALASGRPSAVAAASASALSGSADPSAGAPSLAPASGSA
ncbi:MAG: serine/threonine protein kinase, partial [Chloroflexi bacterium]|nr:serine/threonine protein kinase [Chloroflexota bacterium]